MSTIPRVSIGTLRRRKRERQKIAMLTCYDYSTACLMEEAGIDVLLVGDTYAEVCLGHSTTLPATMELLLPVTTAVRKGAPSAYLVGDMPFLSYQVCPQEAIRNAGRFMAEAGCDCVKVEVDRHLADTVRAMSRATIPVMAHLGLLPQSIRQIGGYHVQGKRAADALRIVDDAKMMEDAGAIALLLEAVPAEVAAAITEATDLPVIGIVSGPDCDGQVVVLHDMLGYGAGHPPKSVKRYANLHDELVRAFGAYGKDVVDGAFPSLENSPRMKKEELEEFRSKIGEWPRREPGRGNAS